MKTITEERREIPVAGETDVLVIGGGLAGVAAELVEVLVHPLAGVGDHGPVGAELERGPEAKKKRHARGAPFHIPKRSEIIRSPGRPTRRRRIPGC